MINEKLAFVVYGRKKPLEVRTEEAVCLLLGLLQF
jgi:hypothetical protein